MIDKAFLQHFQSIVERGVAPVKLPIDSPYEAWFAIDGKIVHELVPRKSRSHAVETVDEIIRLAGRFDGEDGCSPDVWYSGPHVKLVIDGEGHRVDTATMTLKLSEAFLCVFNLAANKGAAWLAQRDFVRMLRIDLAGSGIEADELLMRSRKVEFSTGDVVKGVVARQSESISRDVKFTAKTDGSDLPEEVTLHIPVYQNPGEREPVAIHCSVEVNAEEKKFRLLPMPDELSRVQQIALERIGARLKKALPESVPCYQGTP